VRIHWSGCRAKVPLNWFTLIVEGRAIGVKLPLLLFAMRDLMRRAASTIASELGVISDWVEKCLGHEGGRTSRGVGADPLLCRGARPEIVREASL